MSLNQSLSDLFQTMASIMEIKGEEPFKCISFAKVARLLKDSGIDIQKARDDGTLGDIPGIGKHSQRIIEEYLTTGKSAEYDTLVASIPAGLLPLLQIPGMGPKTIALLWKERGVDSAQALLKAIDNDSLLDLKGMGKKKIDSIRQGLEFISKSTGRLGIGDVLPVANALLDRLKKLDGVSDAQIAGSLRRGRDTIGDVDLLCTLKPAADAGHVAAQFVKFPEVQRVLAQGATKSSIVTAQGLQVDLRIVPAVNFGAAWLYFTGSKDHNIRLRSMAQDQKMTLNEWGLYRKADYDKADKEAGAAPSVKPVAARTEQDVYAKLGLPWIAPELREDRGEIQAALEGKLPTLVTAADIRGDLHTHTTASDGAATIEEMAQAAIALGYQYLAITDHSKSQTIANGLSAERLLKHVQEIHRIGSGLKGIHLMAGCEVDIMADGSLDFPDSVLKELDVVIASPHVALKQTTGQSTDRILRAIDNRYVHVIGHPTGRLINRRAGLPLDWPKIVPVARAVGVALEINAGWPRLDLDDVTAHSALDAGVLLSLNTDAHSTAGLGEIGLGLTVARRAWASPRQIINCLPYESLRDFLRKKR